METTKTKQSEQFWREHCERLKQFQGTQGEYCRLNQISPSKLSYFKVKFANANKFAKVKAATNQEKKFLEPITQPRSLPQPIWLAAFVRELMK